jgi:hypothetical protein
MAGLDPIDFMLARAAAWLTLRQPWPAMLAPMPHNTLGRFVPNLGHPEILRAILANLLATGDVLGRDQAGRIVLAVAVEEWLIDELAAFGTELEDREPEPDEEDDPTEDGER